MVRHQHEKENDTERDQVTLSATPATHPPKAFLTWPLGPRQAQITRQDLRSPFVFPHQGSLQGNPVSRSPDELQLHPVFFRLNLVGTLINGVAHGRKPQGSVPEPILITARGIILSGAREWHAAISDGRATLDCTEYSLDDDEALQLILTLYQSRGDWNDFARIHLAMHQEPYLQSKAHVNRITGGKYKGLANLPEAKHIDVREEIANLAGVCARNVGKVKTILLKAHLRLIEACQNGTISINRALALCRLPKTEQVEQISRYLMERSSSKATRQSIAALRMERFGPQVDLLLRKLQQREAQEPGSVVMRPGTRKQTVILVGRDSWGDFAAPIETEAT
jgi:hypothetical protein